MNVAHLIAAQRGRLELESMVYERDLTRLREYGQEDSLIVDLAESMDPGLRNFCDTATFEELVESRSPSLVRIPGEEAEAITAASEEVSSPRRFWFEVARIAGTDNGVLIPNDDAPTIRIAGVRPQRRGARDVLALHVIALEFENSQVARVLVDEDRCLLTRSGQLRDATYDCEDAGCEGGKCEVRMTSEELPSNSSFIACRCS